MLDSAVRQVLVNRRAVLETDDPEAAHQFGSDYAASVAHFAPSVPLSTAPPCVPSDAARAM